MTAVFFDMDGVLVDSEPHWKQVEQEYLEHLLGCCDHQLQEKLLGISMDDAYDLLVLEYGLSKTREQFKSYYCKLASEVYGKRAALIPGAAELIQWLAALDIPLGIVSSSPLAWIAIVLERFSLQDFFATQVSADELVGKGKPFADIYLLAAQRVACAPTSCIAIEDTDKGVRSAKSAGMYVVGLRNGCNEEQDLGQADIIVDGFSALSPKYLLELRANG